MAQTSFSVPQALSIYSSLSRAKSAAENGQLNCTVLRDSVIQAIHEASGKIDYAEVRILHHFCLVCWPCDIIIQNKVCIGNTWYARYHFLKILLTIFDGLTVTCLFYKQNFSTPLHFFSSLILSLQGRYELQLSFYRRCKWHTELNSLSPSLNFFSIILLLLLVFVFCTSRINAT